MGSVIGRERIMPQVPSIFGQAAVIVAIGFVVVLVLFILIVIWIIRLFTRGLAMRSELLRNGKRIAATVTHIRTTWEQRIGAQQQPGQSQQQTVYIITATAPDPMTAQPLMFTQRTHVMPGYRVGDPVIVLYDPRDPTKYMFASQ
jgi:hypothetical protein